MAEIQKFIEKTIENIIDEPSKAIGATFSDIWFLALGGSISQAAEKRKMRYAAELQQYKSEIESKINNIPTNRRGPADIQVIGAILDESKYCAEKEQLRKMFAQLIASSLDIEKKKYVHPSFANLIAQLSVDEALLLKYLYNNYLACGNRFPVIDIRNIDSYQVVKKDYGLNKLKMIVNGEIYSLYTNQSNEDFNIGITIYKNVTHIGYEAGCGAPENLASYIWNLERMKIVEIKERQIVCEEDDVYEKIIESDFVKSLLINSDINFPDTENYYCFMKKYMNITEYGLSFLKTCT